MVSFIGQNNNIGFVCLARATGDVCGKAICTVCCSKCFFPPNTGFICGNGWHNKRKPEVWYDSVIHIRQCVLELPVKLSCIVPSVTLRIKIYTSVQGDRGGDYKMEVQATRFSTGSCELSGKCELNASSKDNSLSLMSVWGMLAK